MVAEFGILGAVSASSGFTKEIYKYITKLKRAGEDIRDLDARFNNSELLLEHYCRSFQNNSTISRPEKNSICRPQSCKSGPAWRSRPRIFVGFPQNGKTEKAIWAIPGTNISNAEKDVAAWISHLNVTAPGTGVEFACTHSNTVYDRENECMF